MVLGLSGDGLFGEETMATLTSFRRQFDISFPLLLGDATRRAYGRGPEAISPFPFDVVVDKRGVVRRVSTRFDRAETKALVEQLLGEADQPAQ